VSEPAPDRYRFLDFNAPLSGGRADAIARALAAAAPRRVVDIGCGWGELLLRTVAAAPGASGWGVDADPAAIERARANAAARGLAARVSFQAETAPSELAAADVVLCVGSDHAYGGQAEALAALRPLVEPGGRLLFGSGFWERPPTPEEAAGAGLAPESLLELGGLVDLTIAAGFRPLFIQTANRDEWERFESGYLAGWESWLHEHGGSPQAAEVRARADAHRDGWLRGYRRVLGFAYLTLGRPASAG
jgi:SAM-dependent methyltransferase